MARTEQAASQQGRIYWIDNLRTAMIFLVVLLHAGLVYESSGISAFFWIVDDPATNDLSGILNLIVDIFTLPTLFFLSGFLGALSLASQGGGRFLWSRFKRLMVPWFVSVLTLIPLYKVIFLYSRGLPQEHWTTYFHWTNGIWDQNWLWFLPVLFLFDLFYWALKKLQWTRKGFGLQAAVWAVLLAGLAYSCVIDALQLQGWTKTFFLDFQNERILIYFLVFCLGARCRDLRVLQSTPKSKRLYVLAACFSWIPLNLYLFLVIRSLILPGSYLLSSIGDLFLIRFTFLVSMLCLLYLAVNTFRFYLDRTGGLARELNRNSYGVYVIHVVLMGGMALLLLDVSIPSMLKHLALAVFTFMASNLVVACSRRLRDRRRVVGRSGVKSASTQVELCRQVD